MKHEKRPRGEVYDENLLLSSLDTLTPEDITSEKEPKKRMDLYAILQNVIMVLCIAVFVYCGIYLVKQLTSKVLANSDYDDIKEIFYDDSGIMADGALIRSSPDAKIMSITGNVYDNGENVPQVDQQFLIKTKLQSLKGINPDTYGWIKIDGTRIDYPVVQGKDNNYYLHYTFKKEYMYSGALFADCNNSRNLLENLNTVIYGHNMTDGSMFHTLFNFKDKKFFENGLVEITTDDGLFIYEIFSAHVVNEKDAYFKTAFENNEEFIEFANSMQGQSIYSKNIQFTPEDRILTLSTCTNIRAEERFAVHARLISPKIVVKQ